MLNTTLTQLHPKHVVAYGTKTTFGNPGDCWTWTGEHDRDGYAISKIQNAGVRTSTSGHRIGYLIAHGSIPADLVLDHTCRNRGCVNPAHLEPVTNHENTVRQRLSGICRNGLHPMTEANTQWSKDGRHRRCRECNRKSTNAAKRRARAAAA